MNELPDLLVEAVGDATVVETVDIGGGDAVVVTPAETHLYRSEGLLSEESVETFGHDVERLAVDSGRRKHSVRVESIDGERSFTVPAKVADAVVEAMLEGVLRTAGAIDSAESVEAQFRFSDLTLVVTDERLLKHVGGDVWDEEYETAHYGDLTGLGFEEGSVATQVILETDGRQQRVKVPNEHAGRVREAVQSAVFEYHGVSSLGGLREAVGPTEAEAEDEGAPQGGAEAGTTTDTAGAGGGDTGGAGLGWSPPADQDVTGPRGGIRRSTADEGETGGDTGSRGADGSDGGGGSDVRADVEALSERVEALSERLERQTELLETQQETIEQLVDELRRGR